MQLGRVLLLLPSAARMSRYGVPVDADRVGSSCSWVEANRKHITVCYSVRKSRFTEGRRRVFMAVCSLECQHKGQNSQLPSQPSMTFGLPRNQPTSAKTFLISDIYLYLVEWKFSQSDEFKVRSAAFFWRDQRVSTLDFVDLKVTESLSYLLGCALVTWRSIRGRV